MFMREHGLLHSGNSKQKYVSRENSDLKSRPCSVPTIDLLILCLCKKVCVPSVLNCLISN